MIKKSVHEDDIIANMQRELAAKDKTEAVSNLVKAADYVHSAIEILEQSGMKSHADKLLSIMYKIATDEQAVKTKVNDRHTKGLTSEKMVNNLKHHGTQFNLTDDNYSNDLLNLDVDPDNIEVSDEASYQEDFED